MILLMYCTDAQLKMLFENTLVCNTAGNKINIRTNISNVRLMCFKTFNVYRL